MAYFYFKFLVSLRRAAFFNVFCPVPSNTSRIVSIYPVSCIVCHEMLLLQNEYQIEYAHGPRLEEYPRKITFGRMQDDTK